MTKQPTPCPDEYDLWVRRGFKPYSTGHLAMLKTVGEILAGRPASILDVGCGLGYAIPILHDLSALKHYVGIEPSEKCADFIYGKIKIEAYENIDFEFINSTLEEANLGERTFDFTLCIEVIEHIDRKNWNNFFNKIHKHTKHGMFLSTPNIRKSDHGVITPSEMCNYLYYCGFKHCSYVDWQWTTFFIAMK